MNVYALGDMVELEHLFSVDGAPATPGTLAVTVAQPDETVVALVPTIGQPCRAAFVPVQEGRHVVRWDATAPDDVVEDEFEMQPAYAGSLAPTVDDVQARIPTRNAGRPFDETSTPTRAQVESTIDDLSEQLALEFGDRLSDEQRSRARFALSLGAASFVELGLFPEQNTGENGPGGILWRRYVDELDRLRREVFGDGGSGGGGTGGSGEAFTGTVSLRGRR